MIWRDIPGYAYPYRINEAGEVWRLDAKTRSWVQVKQLIRKRATVCLRREDGKQRHVGVARLMDRAFFGGYAEKNGLKAYHKDGAKGNCARNNLLWLTQSQIGQKHGGRGREKAVFEYDRFGSEVAVYRSITAAAKAHGMSRSAMANRISGLVLDPGGHFYKLEV